MNTEDTFEIIFDGMTHNYGKLEEIMADLYQYLRDNPTDEMARYVLTRLVTVSQNMIFSQREFTKSYGNPSLKDILIDNLDSKAQALSKSEIDNLDSKAQALSKSEEDTKAKLR